MHRNTLFTKQFNAPWTSDAWSAQLADSMLCYIFHTEIASLVHLQEWMEGVILAHTCQRSPC